jgi:hypothetical protein
MSKLFLAENASLKSSGLYIGYLILTFLYKDEYLTIYDLFDKLKGKIGTLNFENFINALTFLHMAGSVKFEAPYVKVDTK